MTHLQPLMQQWSEIEPGRCELDEPRWWVYYVFLDETRYFVNAQNPEPEQLRWLEFAIREAIASRGQDFLLRKEPEDTWCCMVGVHIDCDSHPAIAFLKTYLKLLYHEQIEKGAIA